MEIERHPLQPFLPEGARLLMLGSFPPARKRWCMDFFYPNFTNDMWRIFGLVWFNDRDHFVDLAAKRFRRDLIEQFLSSEGIALYDTATAVVRSRNTASDKDLLVVEPTDIDALLRRLPRCTAIVATGQKATDLLCSHFAIGSQPPVGGFVDFSHDSRSMRLYRMPSSSRAYPLPLDQKAAKYALLKTVTTAPDCP